MCFESVYIILCYMFIADNNNGS